jgi:hypothetical protein
VQGNRIAGNGPLADDYDSEAIEGLRGGIVVRMASSRVTGGEEDAGERPALDLRDNHIDQPAGRAVTALAFGPVSCVGNHLNSEREGRMGFVDRFAGAVLILNLGGLHRHFEAQADRGFVRAAKLPTLDRVDGLAAETPAEGLLPGGEVLFNSNRIRTGGGNRAYASQLILTFDDIGYDGNQSGMFKPENVFASLVAGALSLRVTDSRFRERARSTAMSALTMSFGFGKAARALAMNATVHNQGDHCIIAVSNGPPLGQEVLDAPNQVVADKICPIEPKAKAAYLIEVIQYLALIDSQPEIDIETVGIMAPKATGKVIQSVGAFQEALLMPKSAEMRRKGAGQADLLRRYRLSEALAEQSRLVEVREAAAPAQGGLAIDGRVADGAGRAVGGAKIDLVDARGRSLDISALADEAGYYVLELTADQARRLAEVKGLSVRASFDGGPPALAPVALDAKDAEGVLRADLRADWLKDFRADLAPRPVVVRPVVVRPRGPVTPDPVTPDPVKPDPVKPDPVKPDPVKPDRLPLASVAGLGPTLIARLAAAGVTDVESLLALPQDKLAEILGNRAAAIRKAALAALRAAGRNPDNG